LTTPMFRRIAVYQALVIALATVVFLRGTPLLIDLTLAIVHQRATLVILKLYGYAVTNSITYAAVLLGAVLVWAVSAGAGDRLLGVESDVARRHWMLSFLAAELIVLFILLLVLFLPYIDKPEIVTG